MSRGESEAVSQEIDCEICHGEKTVVVVCPECGGSGGYWDPTDYCYYCMCLVCYHNRTIRRPCPRCGDGNKAMNEDAPREVT